jgi:nicotinamide mononucleotide adenylyltransferase
MIAKSTSFVGIHRSVIAPDNCWMKSNPTADVRRSNLSRFLKQHYDDNRSALARDYGCKQSYISDLLRPESGRSFGEKVARSIEQRTGLQPGQLDIVNSPLLLDESRRDRIKEEVRSAVEDLDRDELREMLAEIRKIQARRAPKQKKAGNY